MEGELIGEGVKGGERDQCYLGNGLYSCLQQLLVVLTKLDYCAHFKVFKKSYHFPLISMMHEEQI